MQKITPFLWFDSEAEEAAQFYVTIFPNAKLGDVVRFPGGGEEVTGKPTGSVMTAEFEIDGQKFVGLNGGPHFKFSEAVSFLIGCKDQEEIDYYWEKLAEGGTESQCGWLKDKFGLSWQVAPTNMAEFMKGSTPEGSKAAMQAMLKMKKIVIADLEAARDSV